MQLTPHQPITIPSINLQPRTSTFDWYVYRGQVKLTSRQATIESILLIGHTDRLGSEAYNQKLGLQRAQTVKEYLQSKGVQSPISVKSAGETEPVTADCVGNQPTAALKACLQPDRRVAVDITGTVAQ